MAVEGITWEITLVGLSLLYKNSFLGGISVDTPGNSEYMWGATSIISWPL